MGAGLRAFFERDASRRPQRTESAGCSGATVKAEASGYDAALVADIEQFQALGIDIFALQSRHVCSD
ncbi:MAG: hypothetical protein AB7O64_19105 [Methylibium sp.]